MIGYITILGVAVLQLFIFISSWLATPTGGVVEDDSVVTKSEVVRDIIFAVLGNNQNLQWYFILIVANFFVVVQMLFHMPFTFYIGKEHILQCYDEYTKHSLSLMVDRIKNSTSGDPRFFRAERKYKIR